MAAYVISNFNVTNQERFNTYLARAPQTILAHGGEFLVAGRGGKLIEGTLTANTVVLKFPSMEALQAWYDSPEYTEIISLRTDNTEGHLVFAEEFTMSG
jgi:uncharacterized protein (DUF1330 family)